MVDLFVYLPSDSICRLISSLSRCSRQCTDRTSSWQTIGSENERYVEKEAILFTSAHADDLQIFITSLGMCRVRAMSKNGWFNWKRTRRKWCIHDWKNIDGIDFSPLHVDDALRISSWWLERSMESKTATNLYYARSMPINRWTTFFLKSIPTPRRKLAQWHPVHHASSFSDPPAVDEKRWRHRCHANTIFQSVESFFHQSFDNLHADSILVSIPTLIRQQIVNKTPAGISMKPYLTRKALGACLVPSYEQESSVFFSYPTKSSSSGQLVVASDSRSIESEGLYQQRLDHARLSSYARTSGKSRSDTTDGTDPVGTCGLPFDGLNLFCW